MTVPFASFPWGEPVSDGYLTGLDAAAVWLPYLLVALALLAGVARFYYSPRQFVHHLYRLTGAALLARFVLVPLVRFFVQTLRPFQLLGFDPFIPPVHELSFPSSHVAVLSALAFATWKVRPMAGAALFAGAVLVGVARVLAGVHWPEDLAGGIVVGAVAAYAADNWRMLFGRRVYSKDA